MKTAIFTALTLLCFINGQSQNKNVQETSKTTVITVKTNEGEKKFVKRSRSASS